MTASPGRFLTILLLLTLPALTSAAEPQPVAGVYRAEEVKASPVLTASGIAWWKDRLIVADRASRQLRACMPPDTFEVFKTLTRPVGVAVDPTGCLIVTEKEDNVLYRVVRFKPDGSEETLIQSITDVKKEPGGVGSPHFVAVHPNGTIYWTGFPDGGTRYLLPGAKAVTVARPGIVHTYGIGLSPKHDWLYVNSKIPNPDRRGTWRFPVDKDGKLGEGEFFLQIDQFKTTHLKDLPPAKDGSESLKGWVGRLQGLAVDQLGYIYVGGAESHTSGSAVVVFTPDGKQLAAMIVGVPTNISGLAFGGKDGRTLFITGAGEYRLYQVKLPIAGEVFRAGPVAVPRVPDVPAWPCYQGPNGNFSATDCGLNLVDDLKDARLLWKSQEPTPPGAAQSPRYGGHAWHRISLGDFKPIKIPLADGGEVVSGGGIPLPGGGASSLLVADGRVFASFFVPSGEVVDAGEKQKRDLGPGTWTPDYWRVAADDVVLCVDAATGKTLWKQVFAGKGLNWTDHKSIITNHTGVVFGSRVYVIGSTCRTYCLDAATGKVLWEADLGAEHQRLEEIKKKGLAEKKAFGGINRGHCHGSTFAAGVWVCPDFQGGLIGFDGATGKKLWQVAKCLAHHATPTRWVHADGESILCGNVEGTVRCLDPLTGKDRWVLDIGRQESTLSVAGDILLLNAGKEPLGPGDEKLLGRASGWKITPKEATKLWEHTADENVGFVSGGMTGTPVWKDRAFIRTKAGTAMVEVASGKVLARFAEAKTDQESHAYCAEGRFFHEPDSQHGSIHDVLMLGTSADTFQPKGKPWNTPHYDATGYEMPISHPVVAGRLYLRGADGIYCWDLRKQGEKP